MFMNIEADVVGEQRQSAQVRARLLTLRNSDESVRDQLCSVATLEIATPEQAGRVIEGLRLYLNRLFEVNTLKGPKDLIYDAINHELARIPFGLQSHTIDFRDERGTSVNWTPWIKEFRRCLEAIVDRFGPPLIHHRAEISSQKLC